MLVLVLCFTAAVMCAPSKPNITSYSVDAFLGQVNAPLTLYSDEPGKRYRDGVGAFITVHLVDAGNSVEFDTSAQICNTTCASHKECPSGKACTVEPLSLFDLLPYTTYAGACPGGNFWNFTYTTELFSYCVTNADVPLSYEICSGSTCTSFLFKNYVAGVPSDSFFVIPSYCPCITHEEKIAVGPYRRHLSSPAEISARVNKLVSSL